jgi:hypothetical protein
LALSDEALSINDENKKSLKEKNNDGSNLKRSSVEYDNGLGSGHKSLKKAVPNLDEENLDEDENEGGN